MLICPERLSWSSDSADIGQATANIDYSLYCMYKLSYILLCTKSNFPWLQRTLLSCALASVINGVGQNVQHCNKCLQVPMQKPKIQLKSKYIYGCFLFDECCQMLKINQRFHCILFPGLKFVGVCDKGTNWHWKPLMQEQTTYPFHVQHYWVKYLQWSSYSVQLNIT